MGTKENLAMDVEKLVFYVKTSSIRPNLEQPRKTFNPQKLEELSVSIKEYGIIQPIIVKPDGNGYTIIAGERRWRAAHLANLKEVPVMVKDILPEEILEIALIENVQRENLNGIEEALAYQALIESFNLTHGEIGLRIGKSRTAIANTLRLLKLPSSVKAELISAKISSGHARAILTLDSEEKMEALCKEIIEKGLSVRAVETMVKTVKSNKKGVKNKPAEINYAIEIEENLEKRFNTRVKLNHQGKKGKIELSYASLEDLDRLLDCLGYEKSGEK